LGRRARPKRSQSTHPIRTILAQSHTDTLPVCGYHYPPFFTAFINHHDFAIIATGGTFDKHYNELNGVLGFAESHLPEVIKRSAHDHSRRAAGRALLDSLDMQDTDRQNVLAACQAASEKRS
jgi:L-asparaginase/Glu-tRNA(Gln) amidotransferase subunit D